MNQLIEDLLHNHRRTGLLLNELACQIKQLQVNVESLSRHVESLRDERDRLRIDAEYRAMGDRNFGRH
jgi:serine phosphatase RsbU (regulator of sigma subunit)